MRFDHLASSARVLAVGFIVKIAPADRRDVQKRCQRNQDNKKRMARGRRINGRRLKESLFDLSAGVLRSSMHYPVRWAMRVR